MFKMSPVAVRSLLLSWNSCKLWRPCMKSQFLVQRIYSSSSTASYEPETLTVEYKKGFPTVNVMLPSRDESCLFTLRPLTDNVGTFLRMVADEDGGIENIAVYKKDGTKVAKATSIDNLLAEDFDLVINARKFAVKTPETVVDVRDEGVEKMKDLISQIYTQMNLHDWQANREKELLLAVETLQNQLAPYHKITEEVMEKAEKRTTKMIWAGLFAMGVQFGFLARLTWFEYSWDIMEPITYFVTYGTTMCIFAYYVLTRQEYIFPDAKDRLFLFQFHRLAKKKNVDVARYNELMCKLHDAKVDLQKVKQPLGLNIPQQELIHLIDALAHEKDIRK